VSAFSQDLTKVFDPGAVNAPTSKDTRFGTAASGLMAQIEPFPLEDEKNIIF
jgi:hypothetical protein